MNRGTGALLTIVGLLAGVILGVGGTLAVQHFTSHEATQAYLEDLAGYDDAHQGAAYYCTLGGVVPGMTSMYDPAYLACVEQRTRDTLVEDGVPEARTAPIRADS